MLGKFFEGEADKNKKYYRVIQTVKEYTDGRRFPINEIVESSCTLDGDVVRCIPLDKSKEEFVVSKNNSCSMLMNGFTSEMITKIGNVMRKEFEKNKDNLMDYEMLLPDIMDESIKEGKTILDIPTDSIWVGMTYKEDAEYLKEFILKEIEKGVYPKDLWN